MQHELQMINSPTDKVWEDFGCDTDQMAQQTHALGASLIQQMQRDDITTKTQAFKAAIEQDGENIGLTLDTVNDYFILGAMFTTTMLSMSKASQQIGKLWLKLPLSLGIVISVGVAAGQIVTANANWIGYACMAVLLYLLKNQLTQIRMN